MKETFEYTFDVVRVDARCWFDVHIGNGFFSVHFEFIFVNGVGNVNVPKILRFIFVFTFYGVLVKKQICSFIIIK